MTQSYYKHLLKISKTIGRPSNPPKIEPGQEYVSKTGLHQDIPVEVVTDVQDEIDELLEDIKEIKKEGLKEYKIKKTILNFVRNSGKKN